MNDTSSSDLRTLGELLRQAREAKSRTIEQLASATRINARMIEAIESDDFDRLGTPVYAKGFVRTLAKELGLDERALLSKLDAQLAAVRAGEAAPGPRGATWRYEQVKVIRPTAPPARKLPPWRIVLLAVALALAVAIGVWLGRRGAGNARHATADHGAPATTAPAGSASSPPVAAQPTQPAPDQSEAMAPADTALQTPAAPSSVPQVPATQQSANPAEEVVVLPNHGGLASIVRGGAEPQPARLRFLELRAQARVDAIVSVDGGLQQRRVLDAGQSWKLTAREYFTARVSDPGAVEVWLDGAKQKSPPADQEFRLPATGGQ